MYKIKSILFICTGNSCRSVMAEALMKKYLKEYGKEYISVHSAGISAIDGFHPTKETVEVLKEAGADIANFRSKRLTAELIKAADLILVMEAMHRDFVVNMAPAAAAKTHLLKKFLTDNIANYPEDSGIPDPIGKPKDYYKLSFEVIKDQIERIVRAL